MRSPVRLMERRFPNIEDSFRPRVLIVERDDASARRVVDYLENFDIEARTLDVPRNLLGHLADHTFDAVVINLRLDKADGLDLCKRLRAARPIPIILTGDGDEVDRIVGLELGADSYLTNPYNPRELVAHIRALIRRRLQAQESVTEEGAEYRFSGWRAAVARQRLLDPDGQVVTLSNREFRLLTAFLENPLKVLTRDRILDLTHNLDDPPYDRVIDVMVSRLRRRLARADTPPLIQTVRGEGYLFDSVVYK